MVNIFWAHNFNLILTQVILSVHSYLQTLPFSTQIQVKKSVGFGVNYLVKQN